MRIRFAALAVMIACSKSDPPKPDDPPRPHEDRNEPAVAPPALELAIVVDGKPATWHASDFAKTAHFQSKNDHGGDARETWSLRELAHGLVSPDARVTTIVGNKTVTIDPAAWTDDAHTPILHTTRRGTLKFRWADKDGKWADALVNDVTRIELAAR